MIRQTWAIFYDAYRELNAKRLFWFVLAVSGLVVAAFAAIGINERGITVLWWELELFGLTSEMVPPERLYKAMFVQFGIGFWLSWLAMILALVSTAGMIPEFVASGSIELVLSKPVGRLRLLLTKFTAGLLFVALQVSVFSAACFLVIGIRGGAWEPGLLLAVPLVVLVFSYLYSVCVVIGLLTRSTIATLLLTLLFWFLVFAVNAADGFVLQGREANAMWLERLPGQIEARERAARAKIEQARAAKGEAAEPTDEELVAAEPRLAQLRERLARMERNRGRWEMGALAAWAVKTALPKTGETVEILNRTLKDRADLEEQDRNAAAAPEELGQMAGPFGVDQRALAARVQKAIHARSVWWVIGTSLAFEAVMLGIGAWIFCRRDF